MVTGFVWGIENFSLSAGREFYELYYCFSSDDLKRFGESEEVDSVDCFRTSDNCMISSL